MSAKLVCVKGPYAGQEFAIGARGAVIGRDPASASIVLDFPTISRSHANVFVAPDGRIVVQDLGSTNGTWALSETGERKKSAGETILPDKGRFAVGEADAFIFEAVYAAEAPVGSEPMSAAAGFSPPSSAAPAPAGDTWSDTLRILAKIVFVLVVIGGFAIGCSAYQMVSLSASFLGPFSNNINSGGMKLAAFLAPFLASVIGAFFSAAYLIKAADVREIRNSLTKR